MMSKKPKKNEVEGVTVTDFLFVSNESGIAKTVTVADCHYNRCTPVVLTLLTLLPVGFCI